MYIYIPIQQEGKGCSHHDGEAHVPEAVPVHQNGEGKADEGSLCLKRSQCQAFEMESRGEDSVSASSEDDLSEEEKDEEDDEDDEDEKDEEFCNFAALRFLACLV